MEQATAISIPDLLRKALRSLERRIAPRQIRIVRQIDDTAPEIQSDETRITAVLETLLAEAAAGTRDGGRVRVCLKHSHGSMMISIKDQGAGMAEGEWDARVSEPGREKPEGAPLSLMECKAAVAELGGNLFANSASSKGSTYYVVFPLPAAI